MGSSYNPEVFESQLSALLAKLENGDLENRQQLQQLHLQHQHVRCGVSTMLAEVRTLDLWRAVIGECLATVFYVLLVCGAYSPWVGQPTPPERHLVISMVAGLAMTVLVHCFLQVSGGHVNPAVTLSMAAMRRVSPLRAVMFVLAQLGGGIAGAALLFGATSSGYSGDLGATTISRVISVGQGFGVEFLLSFVVVLAYFSAMCPHKRIAGSDPSIIIGMAYLATTLVGLPLTGASMNPARSLGPAFVMNTWDSHWVYWAGPILGGLTAGFIHEFIFNPKRSPLSRNQSTEGEEGGGDCTGDVGVCAEEVEELRHATNVGGGPAGPAQYNPLRRHHNNRANRRNTNQTPSEIYTPDNIYGYDDYIYSGSKSLYTPASRATNLHRSQSVYTRPLPVPNAAPTANTTSTATDQKQPLPPSSTAGGGGLLHNNLLTYNAQQQKQYQQQLAQQQQQHVPNNINKMSSSVSGSTSLFTKNIVNLPAQSESEYTTNSRRSNKSNLIKPEPVYNTASVTSSHHNNQNQLHLQTQQHQYQNHPNVVHPNQNYQNTANHSSSQSSTNGNDRCSSVLSSIAGGSNLPNDIGITNPHVKCHPGEDDDSSQYGNYRNYGRNRPELPTPGGSVHSDMTVPNSMVAFSHYETRPDKMY
uniref:Neurogenic protein big brain-like n=2 Tax=Hirondellea gigas TaxID=1518452 RepID=A0A6A7FQS1_9CRUS